MPPIQAFHDLSRSVPWNDQWVSEFTLKVMHADTGALRDLFMRPAMLDQGTDHPAPTASPSEDVLMESREAYYQEAARRRGRIVEHLLKLRMAAAAEARDLPQGHAPAGHVNDPPA